MSTHEQLFDVVLFGNQLPEFDFHKLAPRLAGLLNVSAERAEALLREPAAAIYQRLPAAAAREWQRALLGAGLPCNYRPSTCSGDRLELEDRLESMEEVCCPSCGHRHPVLPATPPPNVCERCGVVFQKFHGHGHRIPERRHGQAADRRRIEALEKELAEHCEQETRLRRSLLAGMEAYLGLPHLFCSRNRLLATMALVFVTGMTMGAAGTWLGLHPLPVSEANFRVSALISPNSARAEPKLHRAGVVRPLP